jgi:pimeloyl-ACP methyl ester carboxylesterase
VFRLTKNPPKKLNHENVAAEKDFLPHHDDTPTWVFIHGTFSDTNGSFGKLWREHPEHIDRIFEHYHNEVFALDHPTLGASPIENALMLVQVLPPKTRLHLVTHSRGGLVAGVAARVCASGKISAADESFFESDPAALAQLHELAKEISTRGISVDRIVRVTCPVRGTLLASNRLDAYLSVMKWALELADIPVAPVLVELLIAVASAGKDSQCAPGLAAQTPESPLVQWLHSPAAPLPGDLRVISGDVNGDSLTTWLKTRVSDAFFWTDNDMVVPTRSMYGACRANAVHRSSSIAAASYPTSATSAIRTPLAP